MALGAAFRQMRMVEPNMRLCIWGIDAILTAWFQVWRSESSCNLVQKCLLKASSCFPLAWIQHRLCTILLSSSWIHPQQVLARSACIHMLQMLGDMAIGDLPCKTWNRLSRGIAVPGLQIVIFCLAQGSFKPILERKFGCNDAGKIFCWRFPQTDWWFWI